MKDPDFEKVKLYINNNKFKEALSILLEELRNNPNNWNYNSLTGFCYRALGEYDNSEKHYLIATKLNPNDYSSFLGLGIIYQLKENYSKAISNLKYAINLDPQKIEAINSLGLTYSKMGDYRSAIAEYYKAYEILNNSAFNYIKDNNPNMMGTSKDGDTFEVNPKLYSGIKKILKSSILAATLMNNLGGSYLDLSECQKAKECFLESIELTPDGIKYESPFNGLKNIEELENRLSK